jgi:hypothetical protein
VARVHPGASSEPVGRRLLHGRDHLAAATLAAVSAIAEHELAFVVGAPARVRGHRP